MTDTNTIPNITESTLISSNAVEPVASAITIELRNVTKRYAMFAKPEDRLKQMLIPRLQRLVHAAPSRYFREFSAVNNVSLTIRRGETVGIIGRNGSGKSTLLQMIVGTLQPTSGSVNVHGRIAALLELGAGFNPEFTGRENVYVNGAILGFSREEMDERFEAIAAFAGIGEFIERPVKTYSSGMFVRLAFAVSTAVEPDILVVDEALSVGDEAFQRKCFARIEAIKERGGTILFVSHGAQTIMQLCDRAVLMEAGECILEGEPKAVVGQYQRLVNARDEGAVKVKAEILAMGGIAHPAPIVEAAETINVAANTDAVMGVEDDGQADYFDPNLISQSTVSLEQRGASIRDARITTLDGKQVNVLRTGKRYVFEYWVDFDVDCRNASFGFAIRLPQGIALAGGRYSQIEEPQLSQLYASQRAQVKFKFSNRLREGTYFISCGARGTVHTEEVVMHRLIDVVIFKVAPEYDRVGRSHVNLDVIPNFMVFDTELVKTLHD